MLRTSSTREDRGREGRMRWTPAVMLGCLLVPWLLLSPVQVLSQDVPEIVDLLAGSWEGEGELLGRPGDFSMTWDAREGGFLRLSFRNGWTADDGTVTPVLAAEAVYHLRGDSGLGVWMDSRPQQLTLQAELTDSSMVVLWTAAAETGRTEYVVRGDMAHVIDVVFVDGVERPFAEASYRRR